ncbi:hypothetical protein FQN57_000415 [Myotisia sp. PD_48]|nr:hypothetical protein FQN57_000415 [Myotisia sp. PD_48]
MDSSSDAPPPPQKTAKPKGKKPEIQQDKPLPDFIVARNQLFDELYLKQVEDLKNKPRVDIKVTLDIGDGAPATVIAKSWESTPGSFLKDIPKEFSASVVVAKIDGKELWDLNRPLEQDCRVQYLPFDSPQGREVFWHSSAHTLGEAAECEYGCLLSHGPPTAHGFFYDMAMPDGGVVKESDWPSIDARTAKIFKEKQSFDRLEVSKDNLKKMFAYSKYKLHYINNLIEGESSTVYRNGTLVDLCRGPHIQNTGKIKAMKIMQNSSAYFLGDQTNDALQRIRGVAFPDKKLLQEHLKFLEEAEKRNHLKIGKEQELFFFDEASPGCPFLLPNGTTIFNALQKMLRSEYRKRGYQEVQSPNMYDVGIWRTSGHWAHYKDDMFKLAVEKREWALKPMNCPGHCIMFGHRERSYRELPLRMADFGVLHRNEASGALHGLTRVRKFQQDDSHIFCTDNQIMDEISGLFDFLSSVYGHFGFSFKLKLSTRPEKYLGKLETWDYAEEQLRQALTKFKGNDWEVDEGDGAFYGPKIDITISDALQREHQCATIQLDYQLPLNFKLEYMTNEKAVKPKEDNEATEQDSKEKADTDAVGPGRARPVMIHRAIIGSFERFFGILIEHFGGKWPFWLSPRQILIIPVMASAHDYVEELQQILRGDKLNADIDLSGNTLQKKIRSGQLAQYNFIFVVGAEEKASRSVNIRNRDDRNSQSKGSLIPLEEARVKLRALRTERRLHTAELWTDILLVIKLLPEKVNRCSDSHQVRQKQWILIRDFRELDNLGRLIFCAKRHPFSILDGLNSEGWKIVPWIRNRATFSDHNLLPLRLVQLSDFLLGGVPNPPPRIEPSDTTMDHSGDGNADYSRFDIPTPAASQPPQAFGAANQDGSPITPSLSGPGFADDNISNNADENNDAKRRRIARACDMCRKKKIKCDGKMPKCSHCINYKTECIFTQVEKKRNPPKGAKYIEGLENRLGRMEALLRLSGLLSETDSAKTDLGTLEKRLADRTSSAAELHTPKPQPSISSVFSKTSTGSPQYSSTPREFSTDLRSPAATSPDSQKESEAELDNLSDMMCSLVTNSCGETRYIGSSSGFSIFSPKGIQWVNEKTGDSSFQNMISNAYVDDNKWIYWKPEIFSDIFARRVFKPLPPKEEALSLLRDYFENFNCMFPLFHEPTFMHLVERQYSRDPYEGSGWWASINVALAIAHRLRIMSNLVPQEEDKKAWLYLKNAMGVLTELTMRNTDLLSVQALLGMALFLQGTPNPQPSFFLVAAAIRLAHSIGLHKRCSGFGLNPVELEQRKRVFWIAYILDKDICLRSGRPPVQDDDDMNVELPSEDPPDNIGNVPLSDGKGKVNLFRLMCVFATIESKVYKQLYSTKSSRQSDGELLNTIGELDRELEDWKDSIPLDFRPEYEIRTTYRPLMLPIVVLHFAYYNCLTTIHRMSVHHGYWTSRLSNYAIQGLNARPLNPRVFSSAVLCVSAARASINLIKYIPQGDFSCVWLILYFPISSLVTLFANILQNPLDARARSDVKLMNLVVNFLSMLATDESNGSVKRMLCVCSEFERIAKIVLDRAEKESQFKRKRKTSEGQNPVDTPIRQQSNGIPNTQNPNPSMSAPPPRPSSSVLHQQSTFFSSFTPQVNNPFPSTASSTLTSPLAPMKNHFDMGASDDGIASQAKTAARLSRELSDILGGPTINDAALFNMEQAVPQTSESVPLDISAFQEPFVPQDLWQMPMTLEWDWADMTNTNSFGGNGNVEPGFP